MSERGETGISDIPTYWDDWIGKRKFQAPWSFLSGNNANNKTAKQISPDRKNRNPPISSGEQVFLTTSVRFSSFLEISLPGANLKPHRLSTLARIELMSWWQGNMQCTFSLLDVFNSQQKDSPVLDRWPLALHSRAFTTWSRGPLFLVPIISFYKAAKCLGDGWSWVYREKYFMIGIWVLS